MEKYEGTIEVEFKEMPSIRLESFKPLGNVGTLERLAIATRRRRFSLIEPWKIELAQIEYSDGLNGVVRIPSKGSDKKELVFDGASIPMPWLVSLLTVGILRPLGVMLAGSIVHDYAYKFGSLHVSKDGSEFKDVPLTRHRADALFRDIVSTVNRLPPVGYIAWFFVRIGWVWVKYNGKRFGGRVPVVEYALLFTLLFGLWWLYSTVGLGILVVLFPSVYAILYIASILIGRKRGFGS